MLNTLPAGLKLHSLLTQDDVRGLVFDLDGTIIDSAPDIIQGMRLTFEQAGLDRLPSDYFPGDLHGTRDGIMRSIIADMGWQVPADFESLKTRFVQNYAALDHMNTSVYAGAQDVLEACRDAALPMGICTNKIYESAVSATHKMGIHELFDYISGSDSWSQAKPSPVPLLETIRMLGLKPEQCLYFGDTSVDAECARDAGVRFVLHTAGYGGSSLNDTPRDFMFQRWDELLAA